MFVNIQYLYLNFVVYVVRKIKRSGTDDGCLFFKVTNDVHKGKQNLVQKVIYLLRPGKISKIFVLFFISEQIKEEKNETVL